MTTSPIPPLGVVITLLSGCHRFQVDPAKRLLPDGRRCHNIADLVVQGHLLARDKVHKFHPVAQWFRQLVQIPDIRVHSIASIASSSHDDELGLWILFAHLPECLEQDVDAFALISLPA